MNEHPIIFDGESVRAILAGNKTQTRRVKTKRNSKWIPGDELWVKEAWAAFEDIPKPYGIPALYRADFNNDELKAIKIRWKSSLFMPRWASRITLVITQMHAERLQDISPWEVDAEGLEICPYDHKTIARFARHWDSINAKRGYSWKSNPWVWIYWFKVKGEKNEDQDTNITEY